MEESNETANSDLSSGIDISVASQHTEIAYEFVDLGTLGGD